MRLVVLDTNVIISAAIMPSTPPAAIVHDWLIPGKIQLVTCPSTIEEYKDVVQRPKFKRYGFPPRWLDLVIQKSLNLAEPAAWPKAGADPSDVPFLALAHQAGAWLVTGNLKHFPTKIRGNVAVVSPAEYLAHLQS